MTTGLAYYRYDPYGMEHILPIVAVFCMTLVYDFHPRLRGIAWSFGFMMVPASLALVCNFNIENANDLYLATGTSDGGGSAMDVVIRIAPNAWVRLLLLSAIVTSMFFAAHGISVGVQKLADRRAGQKNTISAA